MATLNATWILAAQQLFVTPDDVVTAISAVPGGSDDPAGIIAALNSVEHYLPSRTGTLRIDIAANTITSPGGVPTATPINYTTGITSDQPFGQNVQLRGQPGAAFTLSATPIVSMTVNSTGPYAGSTDVVLSYTIAPTGVAVGLMLHIRTLYNSTTGPNDGERVRELGGVVEIVGWNQVDQITVRYWNRKPLDATLVGVACAFTDTRIIRTVINFQLTRAAADQGGFTLNKGALWADYMCLTGNRFEDGVPSTTTPTLAGTADTCAVLGFNGTAFFGGTNCVFNGWGAYIYQGYGMVVRHDSGAGHNFYSNGGYFQSNCDVNAPRFVWSGGHNGLVSASGSGLLVGDNVVAGCDTGVMTLSGGIVDLAGLSRIVSCQYGIIGFPGGQVYAGGTWLNNCDTDVRIDTISLVEWVLGQTTKTGTGTDTIQTMYIGDVAGLPEPSEGQTAIATDSLVGTVAGFGSVVSAGGANRVMVRGTGSSWIIIG